jgi:hypothetical protein
MLENAPSRRTGRLLQGARPVARRQVALGFGAVLAAVAVLAVGLGTTGWFGNGDRDVSVASEPAGKCAGGGGGYTELRPAVDAEGLRLLPTWLPPGQKITYASARVNLLARETCSRIPTALVLIDHVDGDRSRVERAAVLTGPADAPFRPENHQGPLHEPIELRGVLGTLTRLPDGPGNHPDDPRRFEHFADTLTVHWTEPDGSSWGLQATHLPKEELVRMAEGLVLDSAAPGPPAAAPNPPEGYEVAWQLPRRPGPLPDEEPWWIANTNRGDGAVGDLRMTITRQAVPRPAIAITQAGVLQQPQLVQVRGHTAVFLLSQLAWDETPDVQVTLQANVDLATLVRIAESLGPVPPDDPRIKNNNGGSLPGARLPVAVTIIVVGLIGGWIVHIRRKASSAT